MPPLAPLLFAPLLLLAACGGPIDPDRATGPEVAPDTPLHAEEIHVPSTLGVADTERLDVHGTPIGVACETCHGGEGGGFAARDGAPERFHSTIDLQHGALRCAACHDPGDQRRLRLADGTSLPIRDAISLCAQCHGPQMRDYEHGAHGGMTGYWDRRRGPRLRNHCVDCHAPHTPAIERVRPVHPPKDRFLGTPHESGVQQ